MNSRAADKFGENAAPDLPAGKRESLRDKIRRIPHPSSYFAGVCRQNAACPENVILFGRHEALHHLPTSHHRFVLILNLRTEGSVVIDHTHFVLRARHGLLIFPYQFHCYANFRSREITWLFVTFEADYPENLQRLKNIPIPLSDAALRHTGALCDLYIAGDRADDHRANQITLTCGLLLEEIRHTQASRCLWQPDETRAARGSGPGSSRELGQKIGRLLEEGLDRPLKIAGIAQRLGISPSHLRNTFREHFGVSLGRYLRQIRLDKALRLIGTTNLTLSEICDRCGYDSLYSFSRTFKNRMRMAPSEYRRRVWTAGTHRSG